MIIIMRNAPYCIYFSMEVSIYLNGDKFDKISNKCEAKNVCILYLYAFKLRNKNLTITKTINDTKVCKHAFIIATKKYANSQVILDNIRFSLK